MKKITLFLCCTFLSFSIYAQFPETFDTGIPVTWATFIGTNGEGATQNWQSSASGYAYCVYENVPNVAEDWLVSPQVAITSGNPILTFDQTDSSSIDYGSTYAIRVSTGASQTTHADFTTVATFIEADMPTPLVFYPAHVDLSAYIGQSIYIAFVLIQDDGDNWYLDNIDLVPDANAPDAVTNPTPADGAVNVPVDSGNSDAVSFDWDPAVTSDPATSYDVYLGDSAATLVLLGNTGNDYVDITGMLYNTEYFWQIVAKNVGGDTASPIWSFTTEANLSVDDVEAKAFNHFFNKDSDVLTLSSNNNFENITFYNLLGKEVLSKPLSNTEELINLSNLSDGVYLAKITVQGRTQTVKLLKN